MKTSSTSFTSSFFSFPQQLTLLVFLVFYFIRFYWPMTGVEWIVNLSALVLFLVVYFSAFRLPQWAIPCSLVMTVLAVVMAPFNPGASVFGIFAANFYGWSTGKHKAMALIFINALAMVATTLYFDIPWTQYALPGVIVSIPCGFFAIMSAEQMRYHAEQHRNRDEIKRLAVVAERERIGRDLHDLLGHTLSLVHLKAQLSLKHLSINNSDEARAELEQIREISSSSLKDVREAVSGYRNQRLLEELTAHKQYFERSGISLSWSVPKLTLPPAVEGELALVVREALTNVIRHADATTCEIELKLLDSKKMRLSITDNGKGGDLKKGNGINGLEQRITTLGGQLSVASDDNSKGCALTAVLPWSYE